LGGGSPGPDAGAAARFLLLHHQSHFRTHPFEIIEGADLAAFPRRACAAPLSQWRVALHRLQAVRGDLPCTSHHYRRRAAAQ